MKIGLWIFAAAVIGFVVGNRVHQLPIQSPTLKTPTNSVLSELEPPPGLNPLRIAISPDDVARLNREMVAIERDSAIFQNELSVMERDFRKRVEAELSPAQRQILNSGLRERGPPTTTPSVKLDETRGDVLMAAPHPGQNYLAVAGLGVSPETLHSIFELTFVTWSLQNLQTELQLTDEQATAIRAILSDRRAQFLELADRFPPPSLRLLNVGRDLGRRPLRNP